MIEKKEYLNVVEVNNKQRMVLCGNIKKMFHVKLLMNIVMRRRLNRMDKKARMIEINRAIYELENQIKSLRKEKTMIEKENIKVGSRIRIIWGGGEFHETFLVIRVKVNNEPKYGLLDVDINELEEDMVFKSLNDVKEALDRDYNWMVL